jgi:hypothetical protein
MAEDFYPLRSRRAEKAARSQTLQHIAGALILLFSAVPELKPHQTHFILACLEVAAAIGLLTAVAFERKHARAGHGSGAGAGHESRIGWLEIAGGVMMTVEAVEKTQGPHHVSFVIVQFLLPLVVLLLGVFGVKLRTARTVADHGEHFGLQTRFKRHRVAWSEMRAYRITPKFLELERNSGPLRRIRISDIANREDVEAWIRQRFEARNIPDADLNAAPTSRQDPPS